MGFVENQQNKENIGLEGGNSFFCLFFYKTLCFHSGLCGGLCGGLWAGSGRALGGLCGRVAAPQREHGGLLGNFKGRALIPVRAK